MKKLLCVAAFILAGVTSYGQGAVTFANSAGTPILYQGSTNRFVGRVGLYGSTSTGLPSDASLTLIGVATNTLNNTTINGPGSGIFIGGTRNIGNPGDTVTLQVRAWSGAFADYDTAILGQATDPTVWAGKSAAWEQIVGGGTNPSQPITGAGRFAGFSVAQGIVPEPSSIALGLLGLGAIALFRRRK
jgi:hypothetical protein